MVDHSTLILLMDTLLAVLLLVGLIYLWRFNRRIDEIRRGKDEFKTLIADFSRSTAQASATLGQLKVSAEIAGRDLSATIAKAKEASVGSQRMGEDLRMMIASAEALADRIEAIMSRARPLSVAQTNAGGGASAGQAQSGVASDEDETPTPIAALSGLR